MRLNLGKGGIRALGVAESFKQGQKSSVLAGVVMRGDLVVDGMSLGRTLVGGDDATASIVGLYRRLRRNDINVILVSGCILSLYNFVDTDVLAKKTRLPVVCLTYKETSGIEGSIRRHFSGNAEEKLKAYGKLGERKRLRLGSGHTVFARTSQISEEEALRVLDLFTKQGSLPEPIKVARLLARAASRRS